MKSNLEYLKKINGDYVKQMPVVLTAAMKGKDAINILLFMDQVRKMLEDFEERITELGKRPTLEEASEDFWRRGFDIIPGISKKGG